MNNTTVLPEELTSTFAITTNVYNDSKLDNENSTENIILELWRSRAWFSQEKIKSVNSHWFKFSPPSKQELEFLAWLYILIMSVGAIGNSLVIFMLIRCKSLRSPANILVANLALSDFTMMMKMPLFIYHSFEQGLPLGNIACKTYGFVGGLTGTVSICTLSCIALDRYYVVVYPLSRSNTKLRSKICIAVSWIYGFIFASLPLFDLSVGTYVPEGYLVSCSFDYVTPDKTIKYFILGYFFAAWIVPFLIICFCYTKIIRVVIFAKNIGSKMEDPTISSRHCKEQEKKKQEIRLALIVLGIIGLWFVAWTPYATIALLGISGHEYLITPLTSMIPALFCKTASCIDPFVYALTNQKFKEELKSFLCKGYEKRRNKIVWTTQISRQQTIRCSSDSDDGVEEVVVNMESFDLRTTQQMCKQFEEEIKSSPKKIGGSSVTPSDGVVLRPNLSDLGRKNRTSWVLRPNFSNRTSSIRNLARTLNKSKQSSTEEIESL